MADNGPTFVVTGATSGIGRATASRLAGHGRVVVVARDAARGEAVRAEIEQRNGPGTAELAVADLAHGDAIERLARDLVGRFDRLDALVNNAAVFSRRRRATADGLELQLAVNYLAPFRLTAGVLPLLRAGAPARIVNVASMEHYLGRIHFDDLQLERHYRGSRAYRQSKLALVIFTRELARRLGGSGVSAYAVHPGVVDTPLLQRINPLSWLVRALLLTPEAGAESPVYVATAPDLAAPSGTYFHRQRPMRPARSARDPETAARLWCLSRDLTGVDPGPGRGRAASSSARTMAP